MNLLVFQAHNDDAAIAAGGTITKLLNKGWRVGYIYFTDSSAGSDTFSLEQNKIVRAKEAEAERKFFGIKDFWKFNVVNGRLAKISAKEKSKFRKHLKDIIKVFGPDVVLIPSLAEGHVEHRAVHDIAYPLVKRFGAPILKFSLWAYPDIYKKHHDSCESVLVVDISREMKKKLSAIRCHKTQVNRRGFDAAAESFNAYLAKIFKTKFSRAEIFGLDGDGRKILPALEKFSDVTETYKIRA